MDEKAVMEKIKKMPVEEKLSLLSESDRSYIEGYIDRAVVQMKKEKGKGQRASGKNAESNEQ